MTALLPIILLLALQALDFLLHAATDQIEPLRVASNAIIGIGAVVALRAGDHAKTLILAVCAAYLALNCLFLFQYGLINPNTGGLRGPLFGFVIGSLMLAAWLIRSLASTKSG